MITRRQIPALLGAAAISKTAFAQSPKFPSGRVTIVVPVDGKSPIKSAAELTAKLKAEPGKHNFGAGSLPARVASKLYKLAAGVEAVYVGYKSNPQAIPEIG